jgi:hypothetical protein
MGGKEMNIVKIDDRFSINMEDDHWTLFDKQFTGDEIPNKYKITGNNRIGTLVQLMSLIEEFSVKIHKAITNRLINRLVTRLIVSISKIEGVSNGS